MKGPLCVKGLLNWNHEMFEFNDELLFDTFPKKLCHQQAKLALKNSEVGIPQALFDI